MERWAINTLRTLGIILTAGFVLATSLFLLLLSWCASSGDFGGNKHPEQVVPYLAAAGTVLVLGTWFIVWLTRGIIRSSAAQAATSSEPALAVPLHLSPLGRKSIDRVVLALAAQIVLGALSWFFNQRYFWSAPQHIALHNWMLILLVPFVLYHVPYAILIYALLKKVDRRALAYSLAIPAILVLQSLLTLSLVVYTYIRHPVEFLLVLLPWLIHIIILVLAYKAIQQTGIHPEPPSLLVAALVTFLYFSFIHGATPFLYRFAWR